MLHKVCECCRREVSAPGCSSHPDMALKDWSGCSGLKASKYGFGIVFKARLGTAGAFMEELIFLFPLPVEKAHTEFAWKMSVFPCCLFWMVYWGKVQFRAASTADFLLPLALPWSHPHMKLEHAHVHVGHLASPWNCHCVLAIRWPCG